MNKSAGHDVVNSGVLQIDRVDKYYGKYKALENICLNISSGEFVALLGPNGAGKTTLFQLLTGLFVPDSGSIVIEGFDISRYAVKALASIGVVFQQSTLDQDLTIRANLKLHTRLHGIPTRKSDIRIKEELTRLGLIDRMDEKVRSLSGGNKRKVELARALLHNPRILFMDEASIGLDPESRHALVSYVSELSRKRGVAVLWATHLVDEVNHADRVVILHKGVLLRDLTPNQLIVETGVNDLAHAFLTLTGKKTEE